MESLSKRGAGVAGLGAGGDAFPKKRGRPSNADLVAREERRKMESVLEIQETKTTKESTNPILGFFLPDMKV